MPVALLSLVSLALLAPPADPATGPAVVAPAPPVPVVAEPIVVGPVLVEPAPVEPIAVDPATAPLPAPKVLADGVRIWSNLPYRTAEGQTLHLDLALPPAAVGEDGAAPVPLLVFVHGGGWVAGTKVRYQQEILARAREGSAAATVEYRLSRVGPGGVFVAPFPAALEDVRAALAFLVDRADRLNADPARIALIGDSAGGHLVLLAGLSANGDAQGQAVAENGDEPAESNPDAPPRIPVAAVVNLFGVTDMPAYYTGSRHARTVLSLFLAGHLAVRRAAYDAASPVQYVDPDDPPVLTLHGTADPIVPFDQAERLHAALKTAGVANELIPVQDGTHGLFGHRDAMRTAVGRFLAERLQPAPASPDGAGPADR
ncbi:alpha/beta hydrolase [Alienimonas californiensis]|uniref:Lipase 2 n=1 Tax=Alienimonas californiensis TaxID=2527989 RepID=A0A517P4J6_9PLAN|nr:alpha/beta hydrolase [Alienimonas californiensis]QDT14290.1 Lipase 2 [Alienimonas californiensis]